MTSQDHSPAKSHIITTAFIYQDLIIGLVFLRWLSLSLCDLVASSSEAEVGELPDRKCRCDEWRRRTGSPLGYIRVTRVWLYSDCELERSSRKKMSCFEWLIQSSNMICNFKDFFALLFQLFLTRTTAVIFYVWSILSEALCRHYFIDNSQARAWILLKMTAVLVFRDA